MKRIVIEVDDDIGKELAQALASAVAGSHHEFHRLNRRLDIVLAREEQQDIDLTSLVAKVTEIAGVEASIEALVQGLVEEAKVHPELQGFVDTLHKSTKALKKAILNNPAPPAS